jgi:hypothetical protein
MCNFFKLNEPKEKPGSIDRLFANEKSIIDSKKVNNVPVSGYILRITYLSRKDMQNDHYWVGIIERLDVTEDAEVANLQGQRQHYATSPDEGLITNTGFAYYPTTQTLVLHRKIGGVNDYKFGVFIRKLIKQVGLVSNGYNKYKMDVIPDLDKMTRLINSKIVKKLEYSFAIPESMKSLKNEKRSIFGDLFMAEFLQADRMKVEVTATNMNSQNIVSKVTALVDKFGLDNLGSLRATTVHNEIDEPLDLLTDKFSDFKDVTFKKEQKETPVLIMETVEELFLKQKKLLVTMYVNKSKED